jgi:hypothetical protein
MFVLSRKRLVLECQFCQADISYTVTVVTNAVYCFSFACFAKFKYFVNMKPVLEIQCIFYF